MDLYNFFLENQKKKNKKNSFDLDVETCVSSLQKVIIEKEGILNNLLLELDKDEKEDKILFDKVINNVKTENRRNHVSNFKKLLELGMQNKLKFLKIPKQKIILKSKKSEPPYHL